MRIIGRAEFLKLPEGTLYKEWEPDVFGELQIKGETLWHDKPDAPNDYYEQALQQTSAALSTGEPLDYTPEDAPFKAAYDWNRNGLFEKDAKYCVFDQDDIDELISLLKTAKPA